MEGLESSLAGVPATRTRTLGDVLYAGVPSQVESELAWQRLVQAIATGDQAALHALYERSHRVVFTLIMRICADRATAEEVTLDVYHDVWRKASRYDPRNGTVFGWIMNQARSRALDRLRFDRRKKRVDPQSGDSVEAPVVMGTDEKIELVQRGRMVRLALAVLTRDERDAIEATYFSQLTHAEAAVRLRVPLGTVKTRIRSGLHKLRAALKTEPAA